MINQFKIGDRVKLTPYAQLSRQEGPKYEIKVVVGAPHPPKEGVFDSYVFNKDYPPIHPSFKETDLIWVQIVGTSLEDHAKANYPTYAYCWWDLEPA